MSDFVRAWCLILENEKNILSILDVREIERQRIAKDLHDISLQNLSHLIHKIELTSIYIDTDPIKAKLELATMEKELRNIINEMRTVIYNMYPVSLEDLGLKTTIEKTLSLINKDYRFSIETDIEDVSCENRVIQISLLRLVQECCYNAIKHSKGDKIFISLKKNENGYYIKVKDNGFGFQKDEIDKSNCHFGLSIMKETVYILDGKMNIESSENGTIVEIEIPFSF